MGGIAPEAGVGTRRLAAVVSALTCTVVLCACGGGAASPPWAKTLGAGVTVVAPASQAPGHGSPGSVVRSYIDSLNGGNLRALCPLIEPAGQATCRQALRGSASSNGTSFTHFALGYVAVDGDRALVGLTGTYCNPGEKPRCTTNNDPAALFSASGASFDSLFTTALAAQNPSTTDNTYSLAPCVRVGGKWYLDIPNSDL